MINVYLCDDNTVTLHKYKNILMQIAKKNNLYINVQIFTSGEQLLFHTENNKEEIHIIYLDIRMAGMDGLSTAKKLREQGCLAELIFLTNNPEYVFDSFDVSPTHYILKDTITDARFEEIFFKAASYAEKSYQDLFTCENATVKKQIPYVQISYFEVHNRIVTVHYDNKTFDFYAKLEALEHTLLSRNFIRVHRSYLVHLRFIEELHKDCLVLITREEIPLGITYVKNVKTSLTQYLNLFK